MIRQRRRQQPERGVMSSTCGSRVKVTAICVTVVLILTTISRRDLRLQYKTISESRVESYVLSMAVEDSFYNHSTKSGYLLELPQQRIPTSHEGVYKTVLAPIKSITIPHVTQCAVAELKGAKTSNTNESIIELVEWHVHQTMHEFFYVTKGRGWVKLHQNKALRDSAATQVIQSGSYVSVAAGTWHSFGVHSNGDSMEMFYCGIDTSDR